VMAITASRGGVRQGPPSNRRSKGVGVMSFKHRLLLIVGIATLLVTTQVGKPSTTGHQLTDGDIHRASSVNRALKGDKLMVANPRTVEPHSTPMSRPDVRSSDIKIGCERPFSAIVSVRSDVAGRCIASVTRPHSSLA
jgi:hypothetical protein